MNPDFIDYALSPNLTVDELYTIELLIDRARSSFDETYYDTWTEEADARTDLNYIPKFRRDFVEPAFEELCKRTSLSFQRSNDAERPLRDIAALQFFPQIRWLALINHEVSHLKSLEALSELRELHISTNPISDLTSLQQCQKLEVLSVGDISCLDFAPLSILPNLRELRIEPYQVDALRKSKALPALRSLEFGIGEFDSFEGFPNMPNLMRLVGCHPDRLDGIEQFTNLRNVTNFFGNIASLEPLASLHKLTHVNILSSWVASIVPVADLTELRWFVLNTKEDNIDLWPLRGLPNLHDVRITCDDREHSDVEPLRSELPSWDTEFMRTTPKRPSMAIEQVTSDEFEFYNTETPYNYDPLESDEAMLTSEMDWLEERVGNALSEIISSDDFAIPYIGIVSRSFTVVIYSDKAARLLRQIVERIQSVLCSCKNDVICYLHSDNIDEYFVAWVYPQKIQVTEEYAPIVTRLLNQ